MAYQPKYKHFDQSERWFPKNRRGQIHYRQSSDDHQSSDSENLKQWQDGDDKPAKAIGGTLVWSKGTSHSSIRKDVKKKYPRHLVFIQGGASYIAYKKDAEIASTLMSKREWKRVTINGVVQTKIPTSQQSHLTSQGERVILVALKPGSSGYYIRKVCDY